MKACALSLVTAICLAVVLPRAARSDVGLSGPAVHLLASKRAPEFEDIDGAVYGSSATSNGDAAFLAYVGASSDWRLFLTNHGRAFTEIARTGAQAPETPDGVSFWAFAVPIAGDGGQVAFFAALSGSNVDIANDHGIWIHDGHGHTRKVMRVGDPVEELGESIYFASARDIHSDPFDRLQSEYPLSINGTGDVAFYAPLTGPGARDSNDRAILVRTSSRLSVIARRGDMAPGVLGGGTFANFESPTINDRGDIAFVAGLDGTFHDRGIFVGGADKPLSTIAQLGMAAPDVGPDVAYSALEAPRLNNAGQVSFVAALAGTGIDASQDTAIYAGAPGQLALVAREGTPAPGTTADFGAFSFNGILATNPIINATGSTAFFAKLTGPQVDDSNDSGLWTQGIHGAKTLVAREGDPAPGGGVFSEFASDFDFIRTRLHMNARGQIAFRGLVSFPDRSFARGIWATTREGELRLIAREKSVLEFQTENGVDSEIVGELNFARGSGGEDGIASGLTDNGVVVFWAKYRLYSTAIFASHAVAIPEPHETCMVSVCLAASSLFTVRSQKRARSK